MQILDFVKRATPRDRRMIAVLTVVAGAANALLVVVVNQVAGLVADGKRPGLLPALFFIAAFIVYFQCDRIAVTRASAVIERLLKQLRLEVVDRLRRSELMVVDRVGRGTLYNVVSQVSNHLSVTIPLLVESFQQAVLLLVSLVYLGYLSLPALGIFLVTAGIGTLVSRRIGVRYQATLQEVTRKQDAVLDAVAGILDGGKELRLNRARSDAVYRDFERISRETEALLLRAGDDWARMVVAVMLIIYSMLGSVAFLFPKFVQGHGTLVFQLVPTLLFCMTPLARILAQAPSFAQAAVGLDTVLNLRDRLEVPGAADPALLVPQGARFAGFETLEYRGLRFSYRDAEGTPLFTAGPLDLTVRRGETIFLVGGNGSGKSTVLRMLTGLYPAEEGRIAVDGQLLAPGDVNALRELFSAIFMDFHLFDSLYGLEHAPPERVRELIREMRLEHVVSFDGSRFSDLRLSTGQRKRLALIAALLEDRPIYVLDEWSAEQDLVFREYFYKQVVPGLKARGKTVLVVTHDERFWQFADRVVRLDLGAVQWDRPGPEAARTPYRGG